MIFCIGSPVTRWASIAFGAGLGIGSAYTDCSRAFDSPSSSSPNLAAATPKITETSVSQVYSELSFCLVHMFGESIY